MKLQTLINPRHKHQQGNPDRNKNNPHKAGPEKLIYLYGYLTVVRWLWEVAWAFTRCTSNGSKLNKSLYFNKLSLRNLTSHHPQRWSAP